MKKIDTIQVGDTAEITHVLTQEDVGKFVSLTGDDNRLHVDADYAQKTSFKKPVVHGMLGASFISTIIGTKLPGDGALWFSQSLEFLLPVRVGDELTIRAEVIKKSEKHEFVELQVEIVNQHNQKVTTGVSKVRIVEQEEEKEIKQKSNVEESKTALVVGGTGGIGQAICIQLARDGFDVIIHYNHNKTRAESIKAKVEALRRKALICKADIKDEHEVKEMFERIGRFFMTIDVLVNSTTIKIANINVHKMRWKDIQEHLEMSIKGAFNLVKAVMDSMELKGEGKIIHLTSQATETPNANWLHYITAKSALNGFSKALAVELAPKGIKVNLVSAGMTETDLIADMPKMAKLTTAAKTPLRRIALPEDIANAVSFLASVQSNFMTGETLRVNGGQVMI